jgi:broad specificity phosphatase PhoE
MLPIVTASERLTSAMRSLEAAFLIGVEGATEIWLVRHGDCYEDMQEGEDPPLSKRGLDQAAHLAERVKRAAPAAIYSSPYRRATETAALLSDDVHVDPRLIEMEMSLDENGNFDFTESPDAVIERIGAVIKEISTAHPGRRVLVVTHGAALITYLTHVLHMEPGQLRFLPFYTSVSVVRVLGDLQMIGSIGDTAHLE